MLRIPNRQNPLPPLYCTEFSVQKIPTQHGNTNHLEGDYKHHETHVKSSWLFSWGDGQSLRACRRHWESRCAHTFFSTICLAVIIIFYLNLWVLSLGKSQKRGDDATLDDVPFLRSRIRPIARPVELGFFTENERLNQDHSQLRRPHIARLWFPNSSSLP